MRLQRSGRRRRSLSSALPTALLRGGAPKKRARERRRGAVVGPARGAILPRGERRRPTMQKVLIALFATGAAALAPVPATGVAANRRAALQKVAGAVAGALALPQVASAD